jgi:phage tail tape-measure protein
MKAILVGAALGVLVLGSAGSADAKGCLKGAVAGGAVGHYAGHHGVAGAAVGCAVGHHEAKKHERERERSPQ